MTIEGKGDDDNLLIDDSPEDLEPPDPGTQDGDDGAGDDAGGDDQDPEAKRGTVQDLPSKKGGKTPAVPKDPLAPKQPPQTVPLATFLQEKNKFTEALETERAERKKLQDQIDKLLNPPKAPPKFAEDPEGYIAHATKQSAQEVLSKLDEHGKKVSEVADATKQTAEQKAEQRFLDDLDRTGQAFAQQYTDYGNALAHVRTIAYNQMKVWHPTASDEQIFDAINKQEIAMARQALAAGLDPHATAYRIALTNGYKPAAPKPGKKTANGGKQPAPKDDDDDRPNTLDPDLTLGRSTGDAGDDDGEQLPDPDTVDPFDDAFKEVFRPRRRA